MNETKSNVIAISSSNPKLLKETYLDLIAQGYSETRALIELNLPKNQYVRMMLEDAAFAKDIEEARKCRAEFYVSEIARDYDTIHEKEEIPGQRLKFEKLMYLAKADNPDRYGGKGKGIDVSINLGQFKLLTPEEALKSLAADPFAVEAEFTELPEEDLL